MAEKRGLEPPRPLERQFSKLLRLPFRHFSIIGPLSWNRTRLANRTESNRLFGVRARSRAPSLQWINLLAEEVGVEPTRSLQPPESKSGASSHFRHSPTKLTYMVSAPPHLRKPTP